MRRSSKEVLQKFLSNNRGNVDRFKEHFREKKTMEVSVKTGVKILVEIQKKNRGKFHGTFSTIFFF